jgi:hypothetical protein
MCLPARWSKRMIGSQAPVNDDFFLRQQACVVRIGANRKKPEETGTKRKKQEHQSGAFTGL